MSDGEQAADNSLDDIPPLKSDRRGFFTRLTDGMKFIWESKTATVGLFLVLFWVFVAIFAPLLTPYTPLEQDWKHPNIGPSSEHILGTDELGRDLWSRLISAPAWCWWSCPLPTTYGYREARPSGA
jgi:peptide/nickel transport system permease protein